MSTDFQPKIIDVKLTKEQWNEIIGEANLPYPDKPLLEVEVMG